MLRVLVPLNLLLALMVVSVQSFASAVSTDEVDPEIQKLNKFVKESNEAGLANPSAVHEKISALTNESLEESLHNLPLDGLEFYLPSLLVVDLSTPIQLPVQSYVFKTDLTRIIYNRRFRKVVAELRAEEAITARTLILNAMNDSKALFDNLYMQSVAQRQYLFADDSLAASAALGAEEWSDAHGKPTLAGVRLGLLALVILAGDLGLPDIESTISGIATEAQGLRDRFYHAESGNIRARVYAIRTSAYQPQVLGMAMSSLLHTNEAKDSLGAEKGSESEMIRLVPFDKPTENAFAEADDNESIEMRIVTKCSDAEFDDLLFRLKSQLDRSIPSN